MGNIKKQNTQLYNVWRNIKYRCTSKTCKVYKHYGGRGITMCNEWKNDYNSFYEWAITNGYKRGLSIDRIDVNGNYEPSNCRWATQKQQSNNTRKNVYLNIDGEKLTITQLAEKKGIPLSTLYNRLSRGMNIEEALNTGSRRSKYITKKYIYKGKEFTLKELAEELKIPYATLWDGIKNNRKTYRYIKELKKI